MVPVRQWAAVSRRLACASVCPRTVGTTQRVTVAGFVTGGSGVPPAARAAARGRRSGGRVLVRCGLGAAAADNHQQRNCRLDVIVLRTDQIRELQQHLLVAELQRQVREIAREPHGVGAGRGAERAWRADLLQLEARGRARPARGPEPVKEAGWRPRAGQHLAVVADRAGCVRTGHRPAALIRVTDGPEDRRRAGNADRDRLLIAPCGVDHAVADRDQW